MDSDSQGPSFLRFTSRFAEMTDEERNQLCQEMGQEYQEQYEESLKRLEEVLGQPPMKQTSWTFSASISTPVFALSI
jgi:hypothetical protein